MLSRGERGIIGLLILGDVGDNLRSNAVFQFIQYIGLEEADSQGN